MTDLLTTLVQEDFGYEGNSKRWGRSEHHDSLVVDKQKQLWWWNSKGWFGDVREYLIKIRGFSRKDADNYLKDFIKVSNPVLKKRNINFTPHKKLVDYFWSNGKNNRKYWYDRLLTDETIDLHRLGYHDGWYTLPLYEDGTFLNFQIRKDEPKKYIKYWYGIDRFQPVLLNKEILKFVNKVYITEGTIDSILLNQLGYPSIAQTGGSGYWNSDWNGLFDNIKDIVYIRDADSAGLNHSRLVAKNLGQYKVRIVLLGEDDGYDTIDFFRYKRTKEEFDYICEHMFKWIFQDKRRNK